MESLPPCLKTLITNNISGTDDRQCVSEDFLVFFILQQPLYQPAVLGSISLAIEIFFEKFVWYLFHRQE